MKQRFSYFGLIGLVCLLFACQAVPELHKLSGYAQGTSYHLSFWQTADKPLDVQAIKTAIDQELARLDQQLSNYRVDSAIEQFNRVQSTDKQTVSEEIVSLINQARAVSIASDGCYDLTVKPLFELWGFSAHKLSIPSEQALQTTLKQVGFQKLWAEGAQLQKLNPQLRVDLSSIAQGYSTARLSAILEQYGIENYLVEIGGELQTRGHKPDGSAWRVAIEKPIADERTMHKILTIQRPEPLVVMTSGTYRHYFDANGKRYSHILNAKTGVPVEHHTVSVTVLHQDGTQADAWSTALLCLGREAGLKAAEMAGISALFIEQDGEQFNEYRSSALNTLQGIRFD